MMENIHQHARKLAISGRVEEINAADRQWMQSHLEECAECTRFAAALDEAIGAVRLPAVMAGVPLVRATQASVRGRALELRTHAAAVRPFWIAVALVCAWTTLTTPLLWAACAWLGAVFSMSNVEWRTGFLFAWIAPTLAASFVLLGSGAHRARWHSLLAQNSEVA